MTKTDAKALVRHGAGSRVPHGFSLIELVLVVVMLGILLSVAVPAYERNVTEAKNGQAKTDIRTIEAAVIKFYTENSRYPTDLAELFGSVPSACPKGQKTQSCDPWYTVYVYQPITYNNFGKCKGCRVDLNMQPLNSDFDLWSNGKNKIYKPQVTNSDSLDDSIRVRNGSAIKLGKEL